MRIRLYHALQRRSQTAGRLTVRSTSSSCSSTAHDRQQELFEEAKALTRSFYRDCLRSIRTLRHGNKHDVAEFEKREKERKDRLNTPSDDVRLSMLSMLPAGNWEDEMR